MTKTAFDTYHPAIAAIYLVAALVFTMAAFHPVFLVMNLIIAVAYNIFLRGWRPALKTLTWQLPLLAIITVLNPIFSQSGSTVLFKFGHSAFYLESLVYGLCMGIMFVAVMQWFSNLSHILTSDKMMQLTGRFMPTIGLMVTMILRLVPQFMRRSKAIRSTQEVCTAAKLDKQEGYGSPGGKQNGSNTGFFTKRADSVRTYLRDLTVLMGWGMEDSLDTSEAMRARGWGAAPKRTTYQRSDFRAVDGFVAAIMGVLIVASGFLAFVACSQFTYYPELSELILWWGYVPYFVLLIIPFILEIKERIVWSR
ncbi:MAG: energy-coupling factor transporter transmembrane component T [Eggerthellaceae bacterium]|nr:energy-coupling factor transporter transmembrane component T [Eggerthellaceae bacterium]